MPGCATETSLGEMGLVLLPILLYDHLFLNTTFSKTGRSVNHATPSCVITFNKR